MILGLCRQGLVQASFQSKALVFTRSLVVDHGQSVVRGLVLQWFILEGLVLKVVSTGFPLVFCCSWFVF